MSVIQPGPVAIWRARPSVDQRNQSRTVAPAQVVSSTADGFMRGHGTIEESGQLFSTMAGRVVQLNRLISVKPPRGRYQGEVGDVVVGRVVEVQQKRWKIDIQARLNAHLLLNAINLRGGELRRKELEDELAMARYLRPGDLVLAEIQQIMQDGTVQLHTRSLRYGKLAQGIAVEVPSWLIRRRKTHIASLTCGVGIVFGCNGLVWVDPSPNWENREGGYETDVDKQEVALDVRKEMTRVAQIVQVLARSHVPLFDATVEQAYALTKMLDTSELLRADVANDVAEETLRLVRAQFAEHGEE